MSEKLRAFKVECQDWECVTVIVAACTHSQARYTSYLSARDVGWDVSLTNFRAKRAPEFDEVMAKQRPRTCWSLDYAQSQIQA